MLCIGSLGASSIVVDAAESGIKIRTDNQTIFTTNGNTTQNSTVSRKMSIEPNSVGYTSEPQQVNGSSGYVNFFTSITGYYRVVYTFQFPNSYDRSEAYNGYLQLNSTAKIDCSGVFNATTSTADQSIFNFGEPEVIGIMPSGVSAYAYSTTSMASKSINANNPSASFSFRCGLNFDDYVTFEDNQSVTIVVRIPFNLYLYTINAFFGSNRMFLPALFTGNVVTNSLSNYTQLTTYVRIPDKLSRIEGQIIKGNGIESEQLQEQKKQGEEKRGFFASVIEWFSNFPNMLLGIVVPSNDAFSTFMDDMRTFVNEKLGFLGYPFELFARLVSLVSADSSDAILILPAFSIMGHVVWNEISYNLTAGLSPFSALLDAIKIGTSVIMVGAFLLYCQRKFDEVLGGATE